jgi:hypothetical protein
MTTRTQASRRCGRDLRWRAQHGLLESKVHSLPGQDHKIRPLPPWSCWCRWHSLPQKSEVKQETREAQSEQPHTPSPRYRLPPSPPMVPHPCPAPSTLCPRHPVPSPRPAHVTASPLSLSSHVQQPMTQQLAGCLLHTSRLAGCLLPAA